MPVYVHSWVYVFGGRGKKKKGIQSMQREELRRRPWDIKE